MSGSGSPAVGAVAFDLDDTLAPSKSPVPEVTATALSELTAVVPVCVISGGSFEQFREQLLARLPTPATGWGGLHLMPTCGTRYYRRAAGAADWALVESRELDPARRRRAVHVVEETARELGLWEPEDRVTGARIEDRGSQVTFSALGQQAAIADKQAWDPDGARRALLARHLAQRLPDLEVRVGGSTSVDLTERGVDKAYGVGRFAREVGADPREVLFVGDRLDPLGNDYPVLRLGVQARPVADHHETVQVLRELLQRLRGTARGRA